MTSPVVFSLTCAQLVALRAAKDDPPPASNDSPPFRALIDKGFLSPSRSLFPHLFITPRGSSLLAALSGLSLSGSENE